MRTPRGAAIVRFHTHKKMAFIDNSKTMEELNSAIRGNAQSNVPPRKLGDTIIPVIDINPKQLRRTDIVIANAAINTTSTTLYTTPANKEFYMTAATLTNVKDATATSIYSRIVAFVNGSSVAILNIAGLALTAQDFTTSVAFPFPIKIDKNTAITVGNENATANVTARATIFGYEVDVV